MDITHAFTTLLLDFSNVSPSYHAPKYYSVEIYRICSINTYFFPQMSYARCKSVIVVIEKTL